MHTLVSIENMTSVFTYQWIEYNKVVERTGICLTFRFKLSGDNNSLSVYFRTTSGNISLVWSVHGNHGNIWNTGMVTYWPREKFSFTFNGQIKQPNTTVAIAHVLITTNTCGDEDVYPFFADPRFKCGLNKYLCDNGVCIHQVFACDGDIQCADGSDEAYCQCLIDQVKCKRSGECVDSRRLCDDNSDCEDGSDEQNCHETCEFDEFYCPSGICIPFNSTCDEIWNCPDGADELKVCDWRNRIVGMRNETICDEVYAVGNCDFEEDFCEWNQIYSNEDDFDWSVNRGSTPSKQTGPNADHSTRSKQGRYIYIEASSPRARDDIAVLGAGPFKPNTNFCFTFHYHMLGIHIGHLNLYQDETNSSNIQHLWERKGQNHQLLWSRNTSAGFDWKASSLDVRSSKGFYLFFEAVRGDGSLGDIALDDFTMIEKNCSEVYNDNSPFCSFEQRCAWKTIRTMRWTRMRVNNKKRFMLEDYYFMAKSSGKLKIALSEEMTERFQCMTFWYKFRRAQSFRSTQKLDGKTIQLSHSLEPANDGLWSFSEMPLRRTYMKSEISFSIFIRTSTSYLGIDEINFSSEPCISFQQGGIVWTRRSAGFYKSLKKHNSDGSITVFYSPRILSRDSDSLEGLKSTTLSAGFINIVKLDKVNYIVEDKTPSDTLEIAVGNRVLVKDSVNAAVQGIVIARRTAKRHDDFQSKLTVRLDANGSDVVLGKQNVWLLPYQLDKHGPAWLSQPQVCKSLSYNGSCYFISEKSNWFDGSDDCKTAGSELAKFESELEEKRVRNKFAKDLPLWIGYHGHRHQGSKFVWSDGSNDLYNKLDKKSLSQGLSAGLCTAITKESALWERRNCREILNVLCRRPGKRDKIICENQGDEILNCSNVGGVIDVQSAQIQLEKSKGGISCSKATASKTKSAKKFACKSNFNALSRVKSKCQRKRWCSLSVKSIQEGYCPTEKKYLRISYGCVRTSKNILDTSETNFVFCPTYWTKFRSSCYKSSFNKPWKNARSYCERVTGATLVSLNDKQEEDFVTEMMKSRRVKKFHIGLTATDYPGSFEWLDGSNSTYRNWADGHPDEFTGTSLYVAVKPGGWVTNNGKVKVGFMCEYRLGAGSCDFETGWCRWRNYLNSSISRWHRTVDQDSITSRRPRWDTIRSFFSPSSTGVNIYIFKGDFSEIASLTADRPTIIKELTLCLWVYINNDITEANVLSFGKILQLMIFYGKELTFNVNFYDWNSTTKAPVSFETWQHLCFSINTGTKLWMFYKDGLMMDIGVANNLSPFSPDALKNNDNVMYLGQTSAFESCSAKMDCNNYILFRGKMTKPKIWSRMLLFHEISILATGCGSGMSPGIAIKEIFTLVKKSSFSHGECISGKGFRLTCYKKNNSSSPSTSTLLSPLMRAPLNKIRGVCMTFTYRILGVDSDIEIFVEPQNMKKERLWLVRSSQNDDFWKSGQVSLGLVSQYRVYIKAILRSNTSEVNVDNILFKEDFCDPVPADAQVWHTYVSNSSSGYLTSPYYPAMYLNNMKRTWKIEVPDGQRIKLDMLFLNLGDSENCKKDKVIVKDAKRSRKFKSYCGNVLPPSYMSSSNVVYVVFQSDEWNVGTGFKLRYQAVAADNIDDSCHLNVVSDCHSMLRCHYMTSNKTKVYVDANDLLMIPGYFPESTAVIQFDNNYLVRLDAVNFENLTQLECLSCSNNKITVLDKDAFKGLTSLKALRLPINFITEIPKSLFLETRSVETLDLGMNWIKSLDTGLFSTLNNLRLLSLRMNFIKYLDDGIFSKLHNLQFLYLDNNEIAKMGSSLFDNLFLLKALILKNNKLEKIKASWFRGKKHLEIFDIGNNNVKEIEPGAFNDLENLVKLDISNNKLKRIPEYLFQPLVSLRDVKVDHFTLCCYAKQNRPNVRCISKAHDGFSSCDELLKNTVLKYAIWILGIMAFAGNLVVIIWRSIARDSNRVNSFLLTNLAVADFLMGIYLLIIAYKDTAWDGEYFKHDFAWRASDLCIFAGVISTVSSEVSVLTLTVITLDRLICIVFPFRFQRWTMKKASLIMSFVWILGFCISLVPLFYNPYFYDYTHNVHFFGRSAVCLPLQLSSERPAGWQYSVSVFLFLNGTSFLFILLAYVVMYHIIVKAASAVRSTRMNQDSTLAKRMMFIILTDFFCWFPVIIISVLALTGNLYDPSKQVYSWIAVFVLPINSSINPFLYTFSTPYVRKKMPTGRKALSLKRRRRRRKGSHRQFSSENSLSSFHDTVNTLATPSGTPQSLHRLEVVNEAYIPDEILAESSFTESAAAMEYCIRLVQEMELLTDSDKIMKSYLAVEVDDEGTPCLLHVYKSGNEDSWRKTTNILSWLSLDNGHDNVLSFLWSTKANKVLVEKEKSLETTNLEPEDCLLCYELPSKHTLEEFLKIHSQQITEETVYCILYDLIEAIDYLSSKQVVHHAILPENIILVQSAENTVESTVLGGLHAAKFLKSSPDDHETNDESILETMKELHINVESFGNIINILLEARPTLEKFIELRDIMASCLGENNDIKPTTSDLLKRLASMDPYYPPSDKMF